MEIDLNDNIYVFFNFIKEKTEAGLFCFKSTNSGDTWTFSKPCGWGGPFATIDTNNVIHLAYWVNDEICYQKSQDGGQTWTEPKKLDSASGIPSQTAIKPNIASDSNNALHVVYDNSASEKSELYYQRSPDGGENWTKKERLTYKTGVFTEPKISADSNLGIHIVWECYTHKEVYYKRGLFTKPEAPTDLGVTAISSNICELTWHDNSNNEDGFKIERSLYADKEFNEVGFVLENITSYTDTEFNAGTTCYYRVRACYGPAYSEYSNTASLTRSTIQLDRTQFYFGATTAGATTGSQRFLISNIGGGTLNWSVTTDKNWLNCNPSSGTSSGSVNVSVDASGLSAGNYIGAINIEDPHASNSPQTVNVSLVVFDSGSTNPPFGTFETPVHGSTVQSSVAVTGWVLDDIGVESVKIYRESGKNLVYIGDGLFVEGARSDIEQAYPSYPMNYKAGWGYMMLTNFLPNEGNGTFKIHAIAADTEGHEVTLGVKTITCDNANAVKPFGAIDTPTQGGTASGSNFINWGWVLTPQPNSIPTDGSTITV
ncbi:MAG: hypothetical protein GTO45_21530, partial [Candidatus Aminicenantes bacterium]|nr:hypothetical protein [Candidatus Aminicenantes bacterium]NIM81337.1 hypothetical protein [Candidatus Aminicenantes bacterium]NIN20748.1 hypothetical protein [Candidatus Aminicenantes bacterium]NIN44526.1 hypothetical protein [Candidatus Aminicenantes bacterium]NIN87346.1 hypothetical protein [Candidatus Aminicenantes bacterium]